MITEATTNQQFEIIQDLANEIWREHYTPIIGKAQVDYMLDKFQSIESMINQVENENYIYYLIYNKNYFGYMAIQPRENEVFLSKIYILKSERGSGHSKRALQFIENYCVENNIKKISLTVNINNTNSIKVYEKIGFKNTGPVVQDIGSGFVMDDYQMEKIL
ncbi:MAG: GNAT family N-acetyltransferase [bacterium]|nr:GNAT family N-acetyltransferase [bacterium]